MTTIHKTLSANDGYGHETKFEATFDLTTDEVRQALRDSGPLDCVVLALQLIDSVKPHDAQYLNEVCGKTLLKKAQDTIAALTVKLNGPDAKPPVPVDNNRTMANLAQEAIDVGSASNLSGVVTAWTEVIHRLHKLLPRASTKEISQHPINKLFAAKCVDLALADAVCSSDYAWCKAAASEELEDV